MRRDEGFSNDEREDRAGENFPLSSNVQPRIMEASVLNGDSGCGGSVFVVPPEYLLQDARALAPDHSDSKCDTREDLGCTGCRAVEEGQDNPGVQPEDHPDRAGYCLRILASPDRGISLPVSDASCGEIDRLRSKIGAVLTEVDRLIEATREISLHRKERPEYSILPPMKFADLIRDFTEKEHPDFLYYLDRLELAHNALLAAQKKVK